MAGSLAGEAEAAASGGNADAARQLRAAKEAFVTGHAGTSKWEIFCIVGCIPMCSLFAAAAEGWALPRLRRLGAPPGALRAAALFLEAAFLVGPQLVLTMSEIEAVPVFLSLLVLWVSVGLKAWVRLLRSGGVRGQLGTVAHHLAEPRKRFISAFRGGTTLLTALGILAVDFPAFPRRLAKAEGYGQGFMDLGVGAVVFAGGLVSKAVAAPAAAGEAGGAAEILRRLRAGLRSAAPLVALGAARLAATSAADYQHHVGEYGTHWNFFLTVAAVALLTLAVPLPPRALLPAGLTVAAAHQAALSLGGLGAWVHSEQRGPNWISLNKEGIGSIPGYWAIHLLGAAAGHHLRGSCASAAARIRGALAVSPTKRSSSSGIGSSSSGSSGSSAAGGGAAAAAAPVGGGVTAASWAVWGWLARLVALDLAAWAVVWAVETGVEPVSRRSCNVSYVLWVAAQCGAALAMCAATDAATWALAGAGGARPPGPPGASAAGAPGPHLLTAFNRNMLALFLAANLMTGAVNLTMNTLATGDAAARAVVGTYMATVCWLAVVLDARGITLKL